MRKSITKSIALVMAAALALGGICQPAVADAKKNKKNKTRSEKTAKEKVDLDGVYHAALGVSTSTKIWINRNAYFAKDANVYYGTEQWSKLMSEDSATGEKVEHDGVFTDAEIKGNGTYTVTLEGADFEGETTIGMLHVSTDIPVCDEITFSDVSLKINDREIITFEEAYMENETRYLNGGMDIILLNHWRDELKSQVLEKGLAESGTNGYDLLLGTGAEKVEVTFTVSGFNYEKEAEATPEPTATEAAAERESVGETKRQEDKAGDGTSFNGGVVAVVAAAIVLCGVVIIVVNGRSKRK